MGFVTISGIVKQNCGEPLRFPVLFYNTGTAGLAKQHIMFNFAPYALNLNTFNSFYTTTLLLKLTYEQSYFLQG